MFLPLAAVVLGLQAKPLLVLEGAFVEACSCKGTCAFETTGALPGCHALGAYRVDRGSYGGIDISGINLAFVCTQRGDLFVYIDANSAAKKNAGERLGKALFGSFGKLQAVKERSVRLNGKGGAYSLNIGNGSVASLTTQPVQGGDGKGFVVLENVHGDPYDRLWQARAKHASFVDDGSKFAFDATSAFFVDRLSIRKRL